VECLLTFPVAGKCNNYNKRLVKLDRTAKHDVTVHKLHAADSELATYMVTPYKGRGVIVRDVREVIEYAQETLDALIETV
jgi:hypothetical protein